jgi:hypothetical protein
MKNKPLSGMSQVKTLEKSSRLLWNYLRVLSGENAYVAKETE